MNISGLQYIPDFINDQEHNHLLSLVDSGTWLTDLSRRVQHYGYKYDYRARLIDPTMKIGGLPEWATELATRFSDASLISEPPDQLIINEYEPGQGIANHVDCVPCFTDTIVSLSLGSRCVMELTSLRTKKVEPLLLEPRSVLVLRGEARFRWMHGIQRRTIDEYGGKVFRRSRRVSLTFRKVILGNSRGKQCQR